MHFQTPISTPDGFPYEAEACGQQCTDGLWHAWIEFKPLGGGKRVQTGSETTQPNRRDTRYWALGLTKVYLEGALIRAIERQARRRTKQ